IRAACIGLLGAVVAVVVGFALSPLTPTGVARLAEPNPGFAFDGSAMAIGAAATLVLVTLIGAIPAWRAATAKGTALGLAQARPSRRGSFLAKGLRSFSPSGQAGVRMALDPGAGRTAVPVRTATFGAAVSLVAVAASLAFAASLDRLVTKPELSGSSWDTIMIPYTEDSQKLPEEAKRLGGLLDREPSVTGYSLGTIVNGKIGAHGSLLILSMDPLKGSITPSLVEGRLPAGTDEI